MGNQLAIIDENRTLSAQGLGIVIRPGADFGFKVLRVWAKQSGTATSAQVRIQLGGKVATFPTLTSSITPQKLSERGATPLFTGGTAVAAGTCGSHATTVGTGSFTPIINDSFNNLTGFEWTPVFEDFIWRPGSASAFAMRFPATPSPTTGWEWGVIIEEM